jgi:Mg2+/Co2+ transporter CorB
MFVVIFLLILISGFLSGSETALTAVNRMKLRSRAATDKKAKKVLDLVSQPDRMITSILIGNNISNVLLPTLVTMVALQYGFSVGIATGILTIVLIIFAEVTPKSIAATFADRMAYLVAPVIGWLVWLLRPLTWLLSKFTDVLIKIISKGNEEKTSFSREELKTMIEIASVEGTFEKEEAKRIRGVIEFYNRNVLDAMKTSRLDITAIPHDASYEEARDIIIENGHDRMPVFKETMDSIVGSFSARKLPEWSLHPEKTLEDFCEQPLFVVETASVEKVFKMMLKEKQQMAVVVDVFGGTRGLITTEDIIEVMIGQEINNGKDEILIDEITDNHILCHGNLPLRQLNQIFNTNISEEADIVSGFIFQELGRIPENGETFTYDNLEIKIIHIEDHRIKQAKMTKLPQNDKKQE